MGGRRKKSKKPSGTKAEQLLERTVFFTDWCLGRQVAEALRAAGRTVELHLDHFASDCPDEEWFEKVGANGWVALTKDKAIRRKPHQRQAVLAANLRLFTLPSGNMTGQEMAEMFVNNLLRVARFMVKHQGPFIARVSSSGIVLVEEEGTASDNPDPAS